MDVYEKSLEILKRIVNNQKRFGYKIYLVGGWAVWIYNPYMKSKDIDFIVENKDLWKLENFLISINFRKTAKILEKKGFSMVLDNDKIELDVYDKKIGRYDVGRFIRNSVVKRFDNISVNVVSVSDMFLLKAYTAIERMGTAKGEKDLVDLLALIDKHYKDIELPQDIDLRKILSIILGDFKQVSLLYPIEYKKFKIIKKHFNL